MLFGIAAVVVAVSRWLPAGRRRVGARQRGCLQGWRHRLQRPIRSQQHQRFLSGALQFSRRLAQANNIRLDVVRGLPLCT